MIIVLDFENVPGVLYFLYFIVLPHKSELPGNIGNYMVTSVITW